MPAIDMNMPILIVDDYRTMLKIILNLLTQLGFSHVDAAKQADVSNCIVTPFNAAMLKTKLTTVVGDF